MTIRSITSFLWSYESYATSTTTQIRLLWPGGQLHLGSTYFSGVAYLLPDSFSFQQSLLLWGPSWFNLASSGQLMSLTPFTCKRTFKLHMDLSLITILWLVFKLRVCSLVGSLLVSCRRRPLDGVGSPLSSSVYFAHLWGPSVMTHPFTQNPGEFSVKGRCSWACSRNKLIWFRRYNCRARRHRTRVSIP